MAVFSIDQIFCLTLVRFARDKNKNEDEGDNKEIKPIGINLSHTLYYLYHYFVQVLFVDQTSKVVSFLF
jgi:hypothetical protein